MRRLLGLGAMLTLLLSLLAGCHHTAGVCDCVEPIDPCMKYEAAAIVPHGMHTPPVRTMTRVD